MKTLQIGIGCFEENPGGVERYYYDCARYCGNAQIQFRGLVAGNQVSNDTTQKGITTFASPDESLWKRGIKIREAFKELIFRDSYDLIVSHFALYAFPVINLVGRTPLITHFHGPWALESNKEKPNKAAIWVKKQLEKTVYSRSSQFIVLSETFRDILHKEYAVPLARINIVPGAVDLNRFCIEQSQSEARKQLRWQQERPTIFCIRRLAKRMGLENLVLAMDEVRREIPDVMLYIAGKGALASALEAQIEELNLQDNVKLLGFVPDEDLPLCYRAANFSVVPTVALEGFGLIVIESLAAGTPVLGTPVGGIPEILKPLSQDLIFAGSQSKQLARGIIEALNGDRKLPTSQSCLDYVENNYTWDIVTQKIKDVYEKAIALS